MATPVDGLAGRRLLVIEDESLLAMMLEAFVAEFGCEIAAIASTFEDAMEKARSLTFDAAILDVNLGGRQSFPIAEALRERGAPFVLTTGYPASSLPASLRTSPVLQKPFQQHQLRRALRAALAAAPNRP